MTTLPSNKPLPHHSKRYRPIPKAGSCTSRENDAAAVAFDKQAVALDPNFAIAYLDLHFASGDWQALEKAFCVAAITPASGNAIGSRLIIMRRPPISMTRARRPLGGRKPIPGFWLILSAWVCGAARWDFNQGINDMREALRLAP